MLKELKFVQGAIAKKDLLPALTHFRIEDGHVRSFNGTLALSSPIAFDIDCTPKAIPFVKAIQNCKDTVSLSMTPKGRLSVKSGSFKAFIDCVSEETPHVKPEGKVLDIDGEILLKAFKALSPFIGDDASKPWTNGVLLKGHSAYATNNVILAEYWIGVSFPFIWNVPKSAIKEFVRINEAPIKIQYTDHNLSFHFEDGRWIRTTLLDTQWPDVERIIEVEAQPEEINPEIFEALEVIKPFIDAYGRIYFLPGKIATHIEETEGASYDIEGFDIQGAYRLEMLNLLKGVAKTIDLTLYPSPCAFFGENIRGVIIGMIL